MSNAPEKVPTLTRLFSARARRKSAKATPAAAPLKTHSEDTGNMPVVHSNGNGVAQGGETEPVAVPTAPAAVSTDEAAVHAPALASQEPKAAETTETSITNDQDTPKNSTNQESPEPVASASVAPAEPVAPAAVAPRDTGKGKQLDVGSTTSLATIQAKKRKGEKSPESSKVKAAKTSASSSAAGPTKAPKAFKPSFLSKLVRKLSPWNATRVEPTPPAVAPVVPSPPTLAPIQTAAVVPATSPSATTTTSLQSTSTATSELLTDLSLAPANPVTATDEAPPAGTPINPDADVILSPPTHILPVDSTQGVTSGAVQPPGSTADDLMHPQQHSIIHHGSRDTTPGDDTDDGSGSEDYEEALEVGEIEDEEARLIASGGAGIPRGPNGELRPLLPPIAPQHIGRKCLVLDLDETLVHSSIKFVQQADYVVPVEIEQNWHNFYVLKRPGVDQFLQRMGEIYEVVVFTASLSKYADPVLDRLDPHQAVTHRLFRESCFNHKGNYVKDLSQLGRPIADTIILDNSPASYIFHVANAAPVSSWFNDPHDTELTDLCPFLVDLASVPDVRGILDDKL